MYKEIYAKMMINGKNKPDDLTNIHAHHILPKHRGGTDDISNITYLTLREHQIAHFLLWKMHGDVNDLRSMKMLSARLSTTYRRKIGLWCVDNKIGIFSDSFKTNITKNTARCRASAKTQSLNKVGTFEPTYRQSWAAKAGKIGAKSQKDNKIGIHNPENYSRYAALGGKALMGFVCMTNGKIRTRVKPEKIQEMESKGYRMGFKLDSSSDI